MAERALKEFKREVRAVQTPEKSTNEPEVETPDVVQLQRVLGNQAVQRLMKNGRLQLSGSNVLQAKLTVTSAGDQYEQEADKVAQQVVHGTGAETAQRAGEEEELQMKRDSIQRAGEEEELQMKRDTIQRAGEEEELQMKRDTIQRAGEEEELQMKRDLIQREEGLEMEEEELVQAKRGDDPGAGFDVGGDLEQTIQAQRGGGQALPGQAQGFFENGFGHDFSGVRVHADKEADSLNQSLSARAFTVGSDIFFRSGEYDPSGDAGKELLAHELTHVVQQGASKVQKKEDD